MQSLSKNLFILGAAVLLLSAVIVYQAGKGDDVAVAHSEAFNGTDSHQSKNSIAHLSDDVSSVKQKYENITSEQQKLKQQIALLSQTNQTILDNLNKLQNQINTNKGAYSPDSGEEEFSKMDKTRADSIETASKPAPSEKEMKDKFYETKVEVLNEDFDPNWSDTASNNILETINTDSFKGSSAVSAECHSTKCFVEVRHTDEETMNSFLEAFPTALGWEDSSGQINIENQGGQMLTSIIITRPGYDNTLY